MCKIEKSNFTMKIISKNFIEKEIESVGFDKSWLSCAINKHKFLNLKIKNLRAIEANILKQTALSADCDCAVHKNSIDCKVEHTDCILSGTISQLNLVSKKLKMQPLSLAKVADEIKFQIQNLNRKRTPKIVGILNLTENSFSDGGKYLDFKNAKCHIKEMIKDGAKIIDIGAESTRPNSSEIEPDVEIERILPTIKFIKENFKDIKISVDTRHSKTAKMALLEGADIINDVSGLRFDKDMAKTVSEFENSKIIITHSRSNPSDMDNFTDYNNLIDEIYEELYIQTEFAKKEGIKPENIIIDVGFGFAKNDEQNFELLKRIEEFKSMGYEIMAGTSRKRFLQHEVDTNSPKEADNITVCTSFYFATVGIDYIRVHKIKENLEAINFGSRFQ